MTSSYNFKVNLIPKMKMGIVMWIKNHSLLKLLEQTLVHIFFEFWSSYISHVHFADGRKHGKFPTHQILCSKSCLFSLVQQKHWGRFSPSDPNQ